MSDFQILAVDDDLEVAKSHSEMLSRMGYRCSFQVDPERVEADLEAQPGVELVLLDLRMPRLGGMDLLRRIRLRRPQVGVVMATVVNDIDEAVRAIRAGAYNYLLKPLQPERLQRVLSSYFDNRPRRLIDDPRFASYLTGHPAFEAIFRRVKAFAEADVPVLIQGETGTGKELIAGLVHALSPRRKERFTAVNVAALTPSLFESELFGHRRGAFTGATEDHAGYFEQAGGGTLFLDEIGELGADQQKKLLRVIETRKYCRIGETTERVLSARFVLATNRDLQAAHGDQAFRTDLYYRLAAHVVHLPPLRERGDDVDLLAGYFLRKYCSQYGRSIDGFDPEAKRRLRDHPFPGNIRELEGIVSSAVLLETTEWITPVVLPAMLREVHPAGGDLESTRRRAVMAALAECDGNHTRAARKLGIARSTLLTLLKKYREGGTA